MYESFFGLHEPAFSLTPDPRFLWPSDTHEEGLGALCYGIESRRGFLLLTGEVGAGKTTLLRAALERLPDETDTALILNTAGLGPVDLLKLILRELGIEGPLSTKADYVIALNAFLLERLADGRNVVLIIDEAQNLDRAALEEVRLLSNLETDTQKLLQIVLTGQPELRATLSEPALRPLRQRIALEHHVESLLPEEIRAYLKHRIHVAHGRYERVFGPGVEKVFFEFSRGCPRLINLLADRVLLAAYGKDLRPVSAEFVEQKARSMAASAGRLEPAEGQES